MQHQQRRDITHLKCISFSPNWSTLIGRGLTLLRSHWSRASLVLLAPAILCHKEPARPILPSKGHYSLVLYGIRLLAKKFLGTVLDIEVDQSASVRGISPSLSRTSSVWRGRVLRGRFIQHSHWRL